MPALVEIWALLSFIRTMCSLKLVGVGLGFDEVGLGGGARPFAGSARWGGSIGVLVPCLSASLRIAIALNVSATLTLAHSGMSFGSLPWSAHCLGKLKHLERLT
jgi:hypothetical protein